jgi:hypothetical protein
LLKSDFRVLRVLSVVEEVEEVEELSPSSCIRLSILVERLE